jgi:membrane protein implicated in regulation of membrane protease activity
MASAVTSVYLFCLFVGGFFVGSSVLAGGHDAGADVGADGLHLGSASPDEVAHTLHLDMDTELAHLPVGPAADHASEVVHAGPGTAGHGAGGADAAWLPLSSVRFWTFGSCFFGMTGSLLTWLGAAGPAVTLALSVAMGAGCGSAASWAIRKLRQSEVSGHVGHDDYVGAIGTVVVPIAPGRTGKVRCTLKGLTEDLLARTDEKGDLAEGTKVLVVGFEDREARVVHAGRLAASPEIGGRITDGRD